MHEMLKQNIITRLQGKCSGCVAKDCVLIRGDRDKGFVQVNAIVMP